MSEVQRQAARAPKLRIHYLVKREGGPIKSGPAGTTLRVGTKSEWAFACDGTLDLSLSDRGTTEPCLTRCDACAATEVFQADWRPHPSDAAARAAMDEADESKAAHDCNCIKKGA